MTLSIPASQIVAVNPGVLAAGGSALDLIGLLLTDAPDVPIGQVLSFSTAAAVANYFGPSSTEAAYAAIYFQGYDGSTLKPGALLFAQYPTVAVEAYLRSGSLASMTLAELKALSAGTVIVTINGIVHTSSSINLSTATSFSDAASKIQTALAAYDASGTGAISGTTLTISAVASGVYAVGQTVSGPGGSSDPISAGTVITAQLTGTPGGIGTYSVNHSQTSTSAAVKGGPALVTYDSQHAAFVITGGTPGATGTIGFASGTLSPNISLTQATGAVTSQGAAIAVPGAALDAVLAQTSNWAGFSTTFEPNTNDKVAFAAWNSAQGDRFVYAMWDTEVAASQANDTTSAFYLITQAGYAGVIPAWSPTDTFLGPFVLGYMASLDFARQNGRTTLAFRSLAGMTPGVVDATTADNLKANGYNFYGDYATAAEEFSFFYPGTISGAFDWADSYVNEIQLNNALQLAGMVLLTNTPSIPFNAAGDALIEAGLTDPILAAVNFGTIRAGVALSASQVAAVNAAAGLTIAPTLTQRGWFLGVQASSSQVRQARGPKQVTLWYVDGQSVQSIDLASILIQ